MNGVRTLRTIEKEDSSDYRPEELINQLDMILLAIREVLPDSMKEALFRKIEEYQSANVTSKKNKSIKTAELEESVDYIDMDLEENL